MTKPNVLLIMTDQQRPDTLGFRGQTPCRTPNIDRLAAEGISFDRAMTPCPLCLPSRASLFTGLYPTQNDMMSNQDGYLTSCQMLDHFRSAGYQINYAGKWHMGEENIGDFTDNHAGDSTAIYSQWCKDQGLMDGWMFNDPATRTTRTPSMSIPKVHCQDLPVDKTNEAYVTDFALQMIRDRDPNKPFFQVVSYNGPHPPFMIPEPYFSMHDPADVPLPENFGPQAGEHEVNQTSYYRQLFLDHGEDFDAWRASYAVYWGFVTMIDDMVGRIIEVIEEQGLMDNTIVLYTSDHGENLGAHGLWQKMVPYDESIRVPLILRQPTADPARTEMPASLVDVAPTLANLCGLAVSPDWPGRDLMRGDWSDADNPASFAMHRPIGDWMNVTDWRMIERYRFKYVWYRDQSDELFDLQNDPAELNNLLDDPAHQSRLATLRRELDAFLQKTNDPLLSDWRADYQTA
ncbi:MAG: sulfatase-like hydrolase/transferase [Rhizobiaceae bacterium]